MLAGLRCDSHGAGCHRDRFGMISGFGENIRTARTCHCAGVLGLPCRLICLCPSMLGGAIFSSVVAGPLLQAQKTQVRHRGTFACRHAGLL